MTDMRRLRRTRVSVALLVSLIGPCAAATARSDGPRVSPIRFAEVSLAGDVRLTFDDPAGGVDQGEPVAPHAEQDAPVGDLREGARFATVYGSAIFGDSGKGEMYLIHGGFGYFFADYQSVSLDLFGGYVRSGIDDNGGAIGLDVVYRNYFLRSDDEAQVVYFNAGLGLQQASTNFSGRRHFNFRTRLGFGASFELDEQVRAFVGADYQHISDAGIEGGGGGFDGPMVYAGVTIPF